MPVVPPHARLLQLNKTLGGYARFACLTGYLHVAGLATSICSKQKAWITAASLQCKGELVIRLMMKVMVYYIGGEICYITVSFPDAIRVISDLHIRHVTLKTECRYLEWINLISN